MSTISNQCIYIFPPKKRKLESGSLIFYISIKIEHKAIFKHAYSHHARIRLAFLSNSIILIDEYYDRVRVRLEYLTWLGSG